MDLPTPVLIRKPLGSNACLDPSITFLLQPSFQPRVRRFGAPKKIMPKGDLAFRSPALFGGKSNERDRRRSDARCTSQIGGGNEVSGGSRRTPSVAETRDSST